MARHDVVTELFYDDAWNSAPAYDRDRLTITRGRGDEMAQPVPQTGRLTLDNRDGTYNPRNASSPLFGLAGRNTPVRVRVQLAGDTFDRAAVANGWGTSTSGQVWTTSGGSAANYSTTGATGRITIPTGDLNTRRVMLPDTYSHIEIRSTVSMGGVAVGASRNAFVRFRHVDNDNTYRLILDFDTAGTVDVTLQRIINNTTFTALDTASNHVAYSANSDVHVYVSAYGSALKAKVWTGTVEPHAWTVEATDATFASGQVGFQMTLASGNTNVNPFCSFDNLTVGWSRLHGEAASWRPRRAIKGDAWTEFDAAGTLRRLGQGDAVLRDPIFRYMTALIAAGSTAVLGYWALTDPDKSTQAACEVPGVAALTATPATRWAAIEGPAGERLVDLQGGGSLTGVPDPVPGASNSWTVGVLARFDGVTPPSGSAVVNIVQLDFAATGIELEHDSTELYAIGSGGTTSTGVNLYDLPGWHRLLMTVTDAGGGNTTVTVTIDGVLEGSNSHAMAFDRTFTAITVNAAQAFDVRSPRIGHVAVWSGSETMPYDVTTGYVGESAQDRLERLCTEQNVPFTLVGTATVGMGPQRVRRFVELLAEVERSDDGLLYEPRDTPGIAYRTRDSLLSQTPVLELDADAGQVALPLDPVVDDLNTRNDITVKNSDGTTYQAVQASGTLSVLDPPDGVGRCTRDVSVSLELASDLEALGDWLLSKGTVDAARYPRVTVDLDRNPDLAAPTSAVDVGDVIELTNVEDGTVDLLVLGYTETLSTAQRKIVFNCAPGDLYV